MRASVFWCLLGALLVAHVAVNAAWLSQDMSLRSHDGGPHLEARLQAARVLRQQGLAGAVALARPVEPGWWPSAGYLPLAAMALALGEGMDAMRLQGLAYLALLLIAVAGVGRRLWSPGVGLLAAAVVGWLPVVYGEARAFGVDLPGAAVLSAAAWLLLATAGFSRPGRCAALGLLLGCGVLIRPQVALFFVPLALAALVLVRDGSWRRRAGGVLLAGATALAVSAPWWLGHLEQIARTFARHQLDAVSLSGNALASPGYYLSVLPWALPLWLLPAALAAAWGWLRGGDHRPAPGRTRLVVWAWLLGGAALVLLIKVHFMRFLLPVCPALALLVAAGLMRLRGPMLRRAAVGLALLAGAGTWMMDSLARETSPDHTLPRGWSAPRPHGTSSGPPLVDPGVVVAQRLARRLARLHPGGRGVEVRMVQTPASGRFRWTAGPVLRLELEHALVLGPSYKGRYLFDAHDAREDHVKIGGTVMPPLKYPRRRQRYFVTFEGRPPELERQIRGARRQRVFQVRTAIGPPRWAALWR